MVLFSTFRVPIIPPPHNKWSVNHTQNGTQNASLSSTFQFFICLFAHAKTKTQDVSNIFCHKSAVWKVERGYNRKEPFFAINQFSLLSGKTIFQVISKIVEIPTDLLKKCEFDSITPRPMIMLRSCLRVELPL